MNGRPVARRSRTPLPSRRTRPVRRASAGLSAVRAGAALAILVSSAAIYGVGASSAFDYTKLEVDGLRYTDSTAVEQALAGARGENLFRLSTRPLEAALDALPTVRSAHVDVRLPGTIAVSVVERTPVLIWQVGAQRLLADADGSLFALAPTKPPAGAPALPVIDDQRTASACPIVDPGVDARRAAPLCLTVGSHLGAIDLDAATRLASLLPPDVGSSAVSLAISVTDENGFVVETRPASWSAVFGFYTPSLRTTEMIPGQVRLLRSLLAGREAQVDRVILASETDGTYTPRTTPKPSPGASGKTSPTASPAP
jgi:hypothetical protein